MMKTIKHLVVLTLLTLLYGNLYAENSVTSSKSFKIGYIDKEAILFQMPEISLVNDSIFKAQSAYQQLYQQYEQERMSKIETLAKLKGSISENMLVLKAKEIEDLEKYMQFLQQIAQEDMTTLQMKLLEPIEKRIDNAIEAVGVEYGFTYITKVRWDDYIPSVLPNMRPILINHYDILPDIRKDNEKIFIPTGEDVTPLVKQKLNLP